MNDQELNTRNTQQSVENVSLTIASHHLNADNSTIHDGYPDNNYRAYDDDGNQWIIERDAYAKLKADLIETYRKKLSGGSLMTDEELAHDAEQTLLRKGVWNSNMNGVFPVK